MWWYTVNVPREVYRDWLSAHIPQGACAEGDMGGESVPDRPREEHWPGTITSNRTTILSIFPFSIKHLDLSHFGHRDASPVTFYAKWRHLLRFSFLADQVFHFYVTRWRVSLDWPWGNSKQLIQLFSKLWCHCIINILFERNKVLVCWNRTWKIL